MPMNISMLLILELLRNDNITRFITVTLNFSAIFARKFGSFFI